MASACNSSLRRWFSFSTALLISGWSAVVPWWSVHPQTDHATIRPTLSLYPENRLLWQFTTVIFFHLYNPSRYFSCTPASRRMVCHMWHNVHPPINALWPYVHPFLKLNLDGLSHNFWTHLWCSAGCLAQCCGTGTAGTISFWPKENQNRNRFLALGSGSGSGSGSNSCNKMVTKNIKLNLLWRDTGWHMHEAGERRNKIKVIGRSFYRKNNLKFKGRNRNRSRNRNRNLNHGKKILDLELEPEPEPWQNDTVPQHWFSDM